MKRRLFVPLMVVVLAPGFVSAQDSAYKALRALGTQRGEKALNQVIAISGQSGRPQPADWRISLDDPAARGGVRELDIVSGQISSERTPARPPQGVGIPIDLTKLNLDSDGAFRAAEQEASRNQVGFDSLNYRLAVDSATGQPVWTLEMFDYEQRPVGTVRIAAKNGALIGAASWVPEHGSGDVQQRPRHSDDAALAGPPPPRNENGRPPADYHPPEYRDRQRDDSDVDSDDHAGETVGERVNRYGSRVTHFGQTVVHRTTRIFQTVGGWFQEKFTGRNTIDPKHGQDDDDESPPLPDPYSQPVSPTPPQ